MLDGLAARNSTYDVQSPDRISYGFGATSELTAFAADNDLDSALLVSDENIVDVGVTDPVVDALEDADVSVDVFTDVKPEPKLSMVEDAADVLRDGGHDLVVGAGGGSVLDTAKLASVLADYDVPITDTLGMGNAPGAGRPLVLIPTTAGTGSEVTHIGVFSDEEGVKRVVYDEALFADVAVVDPELTRMLPKPVAAATGLDALTHAVESYVSTLRTPYSDILAREAIEMVGSNLRGAVLQGRNNDEARYQMSLAATVAGQAFVNSGLGAVHALTYPLGSEYGVGHGRANAMLLPHVMEYNVPAEPERFADIADRLGADAEGSTLERAYASVDAVLELTEDVGVPTSIGHLGDFDEAELEAFTDIAFEYSEHNIDRNPRDLDRADVLQIYRNAL
ncbi:iron-containing alcohol dehydrogenase [Halococcus salifodinae]|uniref:Alcohol dehydrogenase n=1 Tax=Halococcus salifodinae DSM 8989 TaxID=1227456 RepID=M0NA20_9EURY|nr:iron-containing alcohol dehydrogenase [Halococcus salifodinae]EMA54418.1 alcohol dehydrogenase [Halococcus salifodinae DSM 8989]